LAFSHTLTEASAFFGLEWPILKTAGPPTAGYLSLAHPGLGLFELLDYSAYLLIVTLLIGLIKLIKQLAETELGVFTARLGGFFAGQFSRF
jgi:hypothetical protein